MATDAGRSDAAGPGAPEQLKPNAFGPDTRHDFNVLKDGDLFAVFDAAGNLNAPRTGAGEALSKDGLYFRDTRYLSRLVLSLNGTPLTELGHHVERSQARFRGDLANGALVDNRGTEFAGYAIHVQLDRFLSDGLYDRIVVRNYALVEADVDLAIDLWADFRDIFEVRGSVARDRGELQPPAYGDGVVCFDYHAADGRKFATRVEIDPSPVFDAGRAHLTLRIPPNGRAEASCVARVAEVDPPGRSPDPIHGYRARHGASDLDRPAAPRCAALRRMSDRVAHRIGRTDRIVTSRPDFDAWLKRSSADLALLTSELATGPYPYAGTPWFSAPFGRDGIVAALQTLWLDSELAAGVLDFLALTQATRADVFCDAEPGKIIHEHRNGEMCRVRALPFHHYYGGADQTLLFVILAHAYWKRTGDLVRLRRLEPAIRAALGWAAANASRGGDGFVRYARSAETGLRNQGWKDSDDAIFHADGTLAEGPIALVEVQGYHVAALRAAAELFEALGAPGDTAALRERADALVDAIDARYWDHDLGTFCIALDGEGRAVRVSASNAGHLLYCDAVRPERCRALVRTLAAPELNSGWGLRTVSTAAARYNPIGYHNGTVWPHDTSIVAAGLARMGRPDLASGLTGDLFDASGCFPYHRLPELWCGLARSETPVPVSYPSACAPQAWAAGAPFFCLQACLGLELHAARKRVTVSRPVLPPGIDRLDLKDIALAGGRFSLRFERAGSELSCAVTGADGGVTVEGP